VYSINGTPLHDPNGRGWIVEQATTVSPNSDFTRPEGTIPGFDADSFPAMDATEESPSIALSIVTPASQLTTLRALLRQPNLTLGILGSNPLRTASVQLKSMEQERKGLGSDPDWLLKAVLTVTSIWARTPERIQVAVLDTSTKTVTLWADTGMTGKVSDAVLRISGPASGLRIRDRAGESWIGYSGTVPPGQVALRSPRQSPQALGPTHFASHLI
jgi:hypothetical protein